MPNLEKVILYYAGWPLTIKSRRSLGFAERTMAIGVLGVDEHDEREAGIMLPGHLFPLPCDAVQVGSKRRAEDSPYLGVLDVNARDRERVRSLLGWQKAASWILQEPREVAVKNVDDRDAASSALRRESGSSWAEVKGKGAVTASPV